MSIERTIKAVNEANEANEANKNQKRFTCTRATKLHFRSKQGYKYEEKTVNRLINMFGGRPATKDEQRKQGLDYISASNNTVDVKYQPRAYMHKTINIELLEYNTANPTITNPGSWFHSQADTYWWCVRDDNGVEDVVIFNKAALNPYICRMLRVNNGLFEVKESIEGFSFSASNSKEAQAVSRTHGSSRLDNAQTLRVDIQTLRYIQEDFELQQKGISYDD